MIRRARVSGYKSLTNVEVDLERLTVIFGPNATGKSNLFDALALLSRMVTQRTLREAFDEHRGAPLEAFSHAEQGIEALLRQSTARISIEVDVELSQPVLDTVEDLARDMRKGLSENEKDFSGKQRVVERNLRYSLQIELLTESGHLRVVDESLRALNLDGTKKVSRNAFIERNPEKDKLSLRMEGQAHPTYRDIGLDHTIVSTPLYAPHYPHITAFREELSRWRFYYLEPKQLMRADSPLQEVPSLSSTGGNLAAFFNSLKVNKPRQFAILNASVSTFLPRIEKIDVERTKNGELQLQVFEAGIPFPASVVSEGTLRILGLLAIANATTPAAVVGYEEPENGVHPRRLRLIANLLKEAATATDTQYLINTHSPDFLQCFGDNAIINCLKSGANTIFKRLPMGLLRKVSLEEGFEDEGVNCSSFGTRIRRGDYGG